MTSEIEDITQKIIEEAETELSFFGKKGRNVMTVIREAPKEIEFVSGTFADEGLHEIIENENDYLLGVVTSFIYYKTLLFGAHIPSALNDQERHEYQAFLIRKTALLRELVIKVTGK
jgi:hypothetical protein